MAIPSFDAGTGNLPPGEHEATWDEVLARFGYTRHRLELLAGLKAALDNLRAAGCRRAYLDGSFVTAKETPNDYDGCWEVAGVNDALLDPVLLDFGPKRLAQKAKYGGELFLAHGLADPRTGRRYREFFQHDRSENPKGVIVLDLGDLP